MVSILDKVLLQRRRNSGNPRPPVKYYPFKPERFDLESYQPVPIVYQLRHIIFKKLRNKEQVLPEIDGREETKRDVLRAMLSGSHPYLVSEEGTGKTRLARALTKLLPPIPIIRGCPYNDDPKWPPDWLCPRCRASADPVKEYGIEFMPGERRFSRIQGNEYTNESKLLGLKDIQAIAQGRSPSDPQAFTGTGMFRANRGILFVDELPAIRTKVQVLLHPILEEGKAILEEYNWQHPLDLILVATGNPEGFSHVNQVPRPLLDRLELIYMDLPSEDVEKEIMLKERFSTKDKWYQSPPAEELDFIPYSDLMREVDRTAVAPWWIMDAANKTVRYSRGCSRLDKKASIRGTNKAIDHTYASVELEGRVVANLRHAYYGLRLALRGRIGLRPDLVDFENPKKSFEKIDEIVEDMLRLTMEEENLTVYQPMFDECNAEELSHEINSLVTEGNNIAHKFQQYPELTKAVGWLKRVSLERVNKELLDNREQRLYYSPDNIAGQELAEYNYSAVERVINAAVHKKLVDESLVRQVVFVPQRLKK